MEKNLFERFRDGELGEIQKEAHGFASQTHAEDEYYFRAGFFIGRHFDEVLQADMDDSEKKAQQKCSALHEDNMRIQKASSNAFEEEAKDYANEVYGNRTEIDYYGIADAFQAGAEYGWHKKCKEILDEIKRLREEAKDKAEILKFLTNGDFLQGKKGDIFILEKEGQTMSKIELHFPADGDFPETSGEMRAERHCVLAYTESLGWTQAVRRRVGKRAFEWVCSNYDGNTLFSDDEIVAWTELPEPQAEKLDKKCFDLNGLAAESALISKKRAENGGTESYSVQNLLKHCATEVVEAMEAYVEYATGKTDETKREFVSELADIVCCCMIVAGHEDIDLETAIMDCVKKNRLRAEGKGDKK